MKIYDKMAGKLGLGTSRKIDKAEAVGLIPNLAEDGLLGGVLYHDGQFDDSRLAINLAHTASEQGASLINYCKITNLLKDANNKVSGVVATDQITQKSYNIKGKAIINATGVFVDDILSMDQGGHVKSVVSSQGIHLVVDKKFLQGDSAIMIPKTPDGRVLFAVPWHDKVILGTTDTLVDTPSLEPKALDEEIKFILDTAGKYLKTSPKKSDIKSIYAGLRPLAAESSTTGKTKEISRSHKIIASKSQLITVIGGKWTTYRKMAEDIVDQAEKTCSLPKVSCTTENLRVHGSTSKKSSIGLSIYGSDAPHIERIANESAKMNEKIHPKLPYLNAEVIWSCRHEMAINLEDILARRTRAILLDAQASLESAPHVASLMAKELGHDSEWVNRQIESYAQLVKSYIHS